MAKSNLIDFYTNNKDLKYLGKGDFGESYRISKNYAAKFLYPWIGNLICLLQKENDIAQILYSKNISVPKPEGVFNVFHPRAKKTNPAFVMEYLEGETLREIFEKQGYSRFFWDVFKLAQEEIKKSKKLDLIVRDADKLENIIWCPKKEKIYLIDFGAWKKIIR